ncbi:MAG: sigma-70 family RNA polymerase sigma factor [Planctomycetota bacterium]
MTTANSTRVSLVTRLGDHEDHDAWAQFVDIYGPLIYRYGRRRGLQDSDAADLAQDVLREVSQAIVKFQYDPAIGRFRNWLFLIARRVLSRRFRNRDRSFRGSGDTASLQQLQELPDPHAEDLWEVEYRKHLFQWASEQVRSEFSENTWAAFWRTAVEGDSPADVAGALGLRVGSIYVARNRVMRRLRQRIAQVDETLKLE